MLRTTFVWAVTHNANKSVKQPRGLDIRQTYPIQAAVVTIVDDEDQRGFGWTKFFPLNKFFRHSATKGWSVTDTFLKILPQEGLGEGVFIKDITGYIPCIVVVLGLPVLQPRNVFPSNATNPFNIGSYHPIQHVRPKAVSGLLTNIHMWKVEH